MSGSILKGASPDDIKKNREELESLKKEYGFSEPDRGNLHDPTIKWREGKPDYTLANVTYMKGKCQNHAKGSLEEIVENLVKSWESEASHKADISQWKTIDQENYKVQVNNGPIVDGQIAYGIGNYNAIMAECPAYQKYGINNDFEKSHELFRDAFKKGFPWELMKVLSGPPGPVIFTWRHWAEFIGIFQGRQGKGELIEIFGLCRVIVNEKLKIQKLEIFMNNDTFLEALEGKRDATSLSNGTDLIGDATKTAIAKQDEVK